MRLTHAVRGRLDKKRTPQTTTTPKQTQATKAHTLCSSLLHILSQHEQSTHLVVLDDDKLLLGGRTGEHDLRVLEDGVPLVLLHVGGDLPAGHHDCLSVLGVLEVRVSCRGSTQRAKQGKARQASVHQKKYR